MRKKAVMMVLRENRLLLVIWGIIGVLLFFVYVWSAVSIQAYMEDQKSVLNTTTIGNNEITVEENFESPVPGEMTVKRPCARNTGATDCFVRARVIESDSRAEEYLTYFYEENHGFNLTDWILGEDEWFYYSEILAVGEITSPLFTHIGLSEHIPESLMGFSIDVIFESVQSEQFSNAEEAFQSLEKGDGTGI